MDGLNISLDAAEERISQLEDRSKEIIENAVLSDKKMQIIKEKIKVWNDRVYYACKLDFPLEWNIERMGRRQHLALNADNFSEILEIIPQTQEA